MKFGPDVLLEVVSIVQDGLLSQSDISENLRNVTLSPDPQNPELLILSDDYIVKRIRATEGIDIDP